MRYIILSTILVFGLVCPVYGTDIRVGNLKLFENWAEEDTYNIISIFVLELCDYRNTDILVRKGAMIESNEIAAFIGGRKLDKNIGPIGSLEAIMAANMLTSFIMSAILPRELRKAYFYIRTNMKTYTLNQTCKNIRAREIRTGIVVAF